MHDVLLSPRGSILHILSKPISVYFKHMVEDFFLRGFAAEEIKKSIKIIDADHLSSSVKYF